ncbi:hypothetical protein BC830DRAFT_1175012 [Chytriomyces sp. MP71]|nr:hypothetical protein BC830DRAFT_1175012 [Chytriomyces sp. MP71]
MPAPQQKYLDLDYPNPLPEIPPGGISPRPAKPFEFPNEVIPILIAIGSWWFFSVPAPTKRVSLIIAILFSIVESCFYMTTSEDPVTGAIDPDWTSLLQGMLCCSVWV